MPSSMITIGAVLLTGCAAIGFGLAIRAGSAKATLIVGLYGLACLVGALSLFAKYALTT